MRKNIKVLIMLYAVAVLIFGSVSEIHAAICFGQ